MLCSLSKVQSHIVYTRFNITSSIAPHTKKNVFFAFSETQIFGVLNLLVSACAFPLHLLWSWFFCLLLPFHTQRVQLHHKNLYTICATTRQKRLFFSSYIQIGFVASTRIKLDSSLDFFYAVYAYDRTIFRISCI